MGAEPLTQPSGAGTSVWNDQVEALLDDWHH